MQLYNVYTSAMQYAGTVKAKNPKDAIMRFKRTYWMPGSYIAKLA